MATRTIESPGVEWNEYDLSEVISYATGTNIVVMGFAHQGPTNQVVEITSKEELNHVFFGGKGPQNAAERYFFHSALEILNTKAKLICIRLPYGSGKGTGFSTGYVATAFYGEMTQKTRATAYEALSGYGSTSGYIDKVFENADKTNPDDTGNVLLISPTPHSFVLSEDLYEEIKDGAIDWERVNKYDAEDKTVLDSLAKSAFFVVNNIESSIDQDYQGFYMTVADQDAFVRRGTSVNSNDGLDVFSDGMKALSLDSLKIFNDEGTFNSLSAYDSGAQFEVVEWKDLHGAPVSGSEAEYMAALERGEATDGHFVIDEDTGYKLISAGDATQTPMNIVEIKDSVQVPIKMMNFKVTGTNSLSETCVDGLPYVFDKPTYSNAIEIGVHRAFKNIENDKLSYSTVEMFTGSFNPNATIGTKNGGKENYALDMMAQNHSSYLSLFMNKTFNKSKNVPILVRFGKKDAEAVAKANALAIEMFNLAHFDFESDGKSKSYKDSVAIHGQGFGNGIVSDGFSVEVITKLPNGNTAGVEIKNEAGNLTTSSGTVGTLDVNTGIFEFTLENAIVGGSVSYYYKKNSEINEIYASAVEEPHEESHVVSFTLPKVGTGIVAKSVSAVVTYVPNKSSTRKACTFKDFGDETMAASLNGSTGKFNSQENTLSITLPTTNTIVKVEVSYTYTEDVVPSPVVPPVGEDTSSVDGVCLSIGGFKSCTDLNENEYIGNLPAKIDNALLLIDSPLDRDIDILIDGGLSTIWGYTYGLGEVQERMSKVDEGNSVTFKYSGYDAKEFDDTMYVSKTFKEYLRKLGTDNYYNDSAVCAIKDSIYSIFSQFDTFCRRTRKDCIFISDPPRFFFVHGEDTKASSKKNWVFSLDMYHPLKNLYEAANSSYSCTYMNWVKRYDNTLADFIWLPMSPFAASIMADVDARYFMWWAPFGLNNGVLTSITDIAFRPNQAQCDYFYKTGFNPVCHFNDGGFVIWGQKTLQDKHSAFDRINVRRLFLYLERKTVKALRYYIGEPNTRYTRQRVIDTLTPLYDYATSNSGLYDYLLKCDAENNPPEIIDDNTLVVDIYLKPVRTIEFILANFYACKTGANFSELVG